MTTGKFLAALNERRWAGTAPSKAAMNVATFKAIQGEHPEIVQPQDLGKRGWYKVAGVTVTFDDFLPDGLFRLTLPDGIEEFAQ